MKKTMKKILALALVLIMTLPLVAVAVSATAPAYKSYAEAQDGELLYKADFNGDSYWAPSKTNGSTLADRGDLTSDSLTVTVDSTDSTKANFSSDSKAHKLWGGAVNGLALGEDYNYTVRFTLAEKGSGVGFGVLIDGQTGVYVQSAKGRLQKTTGALSGHAYQSYSGSATEQDYAAEVKGYTIALYVKLDTTWTKIDEATLSEYANTNLCLNFYLYNNIDTDMYDLEVYKGLAATNLVDDAPVIPDVPTEPETPVEPETPSTTGAGKAYDEAANGDVLYEVNFNGTAGFFEPIDGKGAAWNDSAAQVSADGKSVTIKYTDDNTDGEESKGRSRFTGELNSYSIIGTSYTITFTVDTIARVGIALDGGTAVVLEPTANTTSFGRYGNWTNIAGKEQYTGTGNSAQTYAIEISFPTVTNKNYNEIDSYSPVVYKLYVLDETTNEWVLIRTVAEAQAIGFDFEAGYPYLDIAIIRYHDKIADGDGNPATATVSNMTIYKGIDILAKKEEAPVTPGGSENAGNENAGNENTENESTGDTTTTEPPKSYAPPKAVTEAATEAQTAVDTEATGCGATLAGTGLVLATSCVAALAINRKKNREE